MPTVTDEERAIADWLLSFAADKISEAYKLPVKPENPDDLSRSETLLQLRKTLDIDIVAQFRRRFPNDGIRTERKLDIPNTAPRIWVFVLADGPEDTETGLPGLVTAIGCYAAENNAPIYSAAATSRCGCHVSGGKDIALKVGNEELGPIGPTAGPRYLVGISVPRGPGSLIDQAIHAAKLKHTSKVLVSGSAIHDAVALVQGKRDALYCYKQSPLVAVIVAALAAAAGGKCDIDWPNLQSWLDEVSFKCGDLACMEDDAPMPHGSRPSHR